MNMESSGAKAWRFHVRFVISFVRLGLGEIVFESPPQNHRLKLSLSPFERKLSRPRCRFLFRSANTSCRLRRSYTRDDERCSLSRMKIRRACVRRLIISRTIICGQVIHLLHHVSPDFVGFHLRYRSRVQKAVDPRCVPYFSRLPELLCVARYRVSVRINGLWSAISPERCVSVSLQKPNIW